MTTPPPEAKPLPCPWCGEEPEVLGDCAHGVRCPNENCVVEPQTITFATRAIAIAAWNTRANTEAQ